MPLLPIDHGAPLPGWLREVTTEALAARWWTLYRRPIGPRRPCRHRVCYRAPVGPPAPTISRRLLDLEVGAAFHTDASELAVRALARGLGVGIVIHATTSGLRVRRVS